jgi:hypothetical protein
MIEKLVIAPQIIVYKNALSNSRSIIDMIESADEVKWETWYENGWRSSVDFDKTKGEESSPIQDICNAFDYVANDYMSDYSGDRGVWPTFIKNWDSTNLNQDNYKIDFFKYSHLSFENMKWESDLLMKYHVDEFDADGVFKKYKNIVTINFYLNDDYEGGEICAYNKDLNVSYRYKPVAGDAVVMPSASPFFHAVKPFYIKDRYFLRLFITYDQGEDVANNYGDFYSEEHHVGHQAEKDFIDKDFQFLNVNIKEVEVR